MRRALFAGGVLAAFELVLVLASGSDLFLSWVELTRYALLAASALPLACAGVFVAGRALWSLAADRAYDGSSFARRLRVVIACVAAPPLGCALWLLTAGRRVRDAPLRAPAVIALALGSALALAWWLARLARLHARGARPRGLVAGCFALAALALAADAHILHRLYPAFHVSLAVISVLAATLAAAFMPERGDPVRAHDRLWIVAFALVALPSLWMLARAPNARFAILESAPFSGKLLGLVHPPAPRISAVAKPQVPPQAAAPRPGIDLRGRDVLLVTIDALRADRLRAYGGHGVTPGLDALAAESLVFERAYTPTPHTSYALTSLMTGKFMQPLLALANAADDQPTLPELLRRYGYRTAAFYPPAIFFVDGERFEAFRKENLGFEYVKAMFAPARERVPQLEQYLREVAPGHPLFVWVHLFEPHEPYEPLPEYERGDRPVDRYDGEVAAADAATSALIAAFRRARPGSTVIVSADHGEEFGEHGGHHHGTTLYDEQVRVPLLWSSPGATPRGRVRVPVEILDITTSLLAALGIPRDVRMRGDDLGPWLRDPTAPGELTAFAMIAGARMACDGRRKLVCSDDDCRLYDLQSDPGERRDAALDRPERLEDRERLKAQLASFEASIPQVEALAMQGGGEWPRALVRARLGDREVARELPSLLDSPRADVRAAAARALGELGVEIPNVLGSLGRMRISDPDLAVRAEAAIATVRLGSGDFDPALQIHGGYRARQAVIELLGGSDPELVARAALALATRGDFAGEDVLIARAQNTALDEPQRIAAIRALGAQGRSRAGAALVPLLAEVRIRAEVAAALGRIRDPSLAPALALALAEDRYPESRVAEADALLALGARSDAVALTRRFLGTESSLPDGVRVLLDAGALERSSGAGADLRSAARVRSGSAWHCETRGCTPTHGALLVLPDAGAPKGAARAILRVIAEGEGRELRIAEERRALAPGANELAFGVQGKGGLHIALEADDGVFVQAVAVVPRATDVPPPPPEPWTPEAGENGSGHTSGQ